MPQDDAEAKRTIWASGAAQHIIDGILAAIERYPRTDRTALLREIARRSLWHMPNSGDEVRDLARHFDIENLRQPHPRDDDPPEGPAGRK
jgi:hypothetical protein